MMLDDRPSRDPSENDAIPTATDPAVADDLVDEDLDAMLATITIVEEDDDR